MANVHCFLVILSSDSNENKYSSDGKIKLQFLLLFTFFFFENFLKISKIFLVLQTCSFIFFSLNIFRKIFKSFLLCRLVQLICRLVHFFSWPFFEKIKKKKKRIKKNVSKNFQKTFKKFYFADLFIILQTCSLFLQTCSKCSKLLKIQFSSNVIMQKYLSQKY